MAALEGVVEPVYPAHTNAFFARLPEAAVEPLQRLFAFHRWPRHPHPPGDEPLVRWMTGWDTRPQDVDTFARAVREEVEKGP